MWVFEWVFCWYGSGGAVVFNQPGMRSKSLLVKPQGISGVDTPQAASGVMLTQAKSRRVA